jgi:hypothetical protein
VGTGTRDGEGVTTTFMLVVVVEPSERVKREAELNDVGGKVVLNELGVVVEVGVVVTTCFDDFEGVEVVEVEELDKPEL